MRVWWKGEGGISLFPLLLCFVMFCVCSLCLQDQRNYSECYFHNSRAWENTNISLLKTHSHVYYALIMPYLLVCWKCYHMSYLIPSSRPPFGFCTLGLSRLLLLSLENDRKLPYPMLLAHFSLLIFPFFTLASPFIAPFICFPHFFISFLLLCCHTPETLFLTSTISLVLQMGLFSQWWSLIHPLGILHLPSGRCPSCTG